MVQTSHTEDGSNKTVKDCLTMLGVTVDDFNECEDLKAEFVVIKRANRAKCLECHPDKGGNEEDFRNVRTAFEVLRDHFEKGNIDSFATATATATPANTYDSTYESWAERPAPRWEYYYNAPTEGVPLYRVERAKSGRSKCRQKHGTAKKCTNSFIPKSSLRVGSIDVEAGTYTRWHHLVCWLVPPQVWMGIPDLTDADAVKQALRGMNEYLFTGMQELNDEEQDALVQHVMNRSHWKSTGGPVRCARSRNNNAPPAKQAKISSAAAADSPPGSSIASTVHKRDGLSIQVDHTSAVIDLTEDDPPEQRLVTRQERPKTKSKNRSSSVATTDRFLPPKPGVNGAMPHALQGKRVVLTGVFPEVGGGIGLNLGKDRVKAIIESFGGRVTSAVSGRTNMVIVGAAPGQRKVFEGKKRGVQLLTLPKLKACLEAGCLEVAQPPLTITQFSTGYRNNALRLLDRYESGPNPNNGSAQPNNGKHKRKWGELAN